MRVFFSFTSRLSAVGCKLVNALGTLHAWQRYCEIRQLPMPNLTSLYTTHASFKLVVCMDYCTLSSGTPGFDYDAHLAHLRACNVMPPWESMESTVGDRWQQTLHSPIQQPMHACLTALGFQEDVGEDADSLLAFFTENMRDVEEATLDRLMQNS